MNQEIQNKPKMTECNRCKDAGFPGTLIFFVNSGQKKADGKIKWDIFSEDYSIHQHKQAGTTTIENVIREKAVEQNNGLDRLITALSEVANALECQCLTSLATTEAERSHVKERLAKK